ncbi:MAG: serine/threonine protein kinase [Planctomycetaceae bacterium]|nr:serine/threonine protein kinase [Planctomycetaceae bacterium]
MSAEQILIDYPSLAASETYCLDIIYNEFLIQAHIGVRAETPWCPCPVAFLHRFPQFSTQLREQFQIYKCLESEVEDVDLAPTGPDFPEWGVVPATAPAVIHGVADGKLLQERYLLLERIGGGAAADVFRAQDLRLRREVAVKISRTPFSDESRISRRFLREAESAARLSHPGIVSVYEFGEVERHPFLVTRLLAGGTMAERIAGGLPSPEDACRWMLRLCDAISYAHESGVIHRDLKPANILFDQEGRPLVADFGLAALQEIDSTLTRSGEILGTPAYMSPEQAMGSGQTGPLSDIYSLGVILYQLLTGHLPYSGTTAAVLARKQYEEPVPPRSLHAGVPVDLQTICLKAMAVAAVERFPTARSMREDLQRYLNGESIHARPARNADRLARVVRRYPLASLLLLLLVLLAGIMTGGVFQYRNVRLQRDRANTAESNAHQLMLQDMVITGQLAQQKGATRSAITRFRKALQEEYSDAAMLHLHLAECLLEEGDANAALIHLQSIDHQPVTSGQRARIQLLQAQLTLLDAQTPGESIQALDAIQTHDLSEADRQFVEGLRADTSVDALGHFRRAVELNAHHRAARRMACTLAMSLADFEYADRLTDTSRQLFPEDVNFQLLKALTLAAGNHPEQADVLIRNARLPTDETIAWMALVQQIHQIRTQFSVGADRVFARDPAAGDSEFSFIELTELLLSFRRDVLPALRRRQLMLPPRSETAFAEFLNVLPPSTSEVGAERHSAANSDQPTPIDQRLIPAGLELIRVHPEGSLGVIIAGELLDADLVGRDELLKLEAFYRTAQSSHSFIPDVQPHAQMGRFTVAIHLSLIEKHEPDANRELAFDLLESLEPSSIMEPNTARVLTILPLQNGVGKWSLAQRFAPRWIELARRDGDPRRLAEALWHQAVLAEHFEQWLSLLNLCDEILSIVPEQSEWGQNMRPDQLKATATERLRHRLGRDRIPAP